MNSTTLTGSCLCGSVKYSVTTEIEHFYFYHCEQCRKITGSSFASNILAKPANVDWISGSENVKRFDYPGTRSFTKVFCSNCGSGLPSLNENGNILFRKMYRRPSPHKIMSMPGTHKCIHPTAQPFQGDK